MLLPERMRVGLVDPAGGSTSDLLDEEGDAVEEDLIEARLELEPEDLVTFLEDC